MQKDSHLYITTIDIPLTGYLHSGQKAKAVVASGTPAVKVTDREGNQAMLMDGAVVPFKWDSPIFHAFFTEA
jgi:hypothetical protein